MSGAPLAGGPLPPWAFHVVHHACDPLVTDVLLRCSHMIGDGQLFMQLLKDVLTEEEGGEVARIGGAEPAGEGQPAAAAGAGARNAGGGGSSASGGGSGGGGDAVCFLELGGAARGGKAAVGSGGGFAGLVAARALGGGVDARGESFSSLGSTPSASSGGSSSGGWSTAGTRPSAATGDGRRRGGGGSMAHALWR